MSEPVQEAARKPRLFWLGAHKLLVSTELRRLRSLGFEVFNPPYLSHVNDQSAITRWDAAQETTLPPDVFNRLSRTNFFYNFIEEEVADLLNSYFDAIVVTIVARWAVEVARAFRGPVIYRTYGQTSFLSDDLEAIDARPLLESRANFHFCPHAEEAIDGEAEWLRQRATIVPYCLGEEIFSVSNTWSGQSTSGDILLVAPHILGNPFHLSHYYFLKEYFYQPHFRMCGVQIQSIEDEQVVHSLPREAHLRMFAAASGLLYTYRDPRVCYLPPIEMMTIGGPVVYLSGSLLARCIGAGGPGEARTLSDAHRLVARLRSGDRPFIRDVQASQVEVRDRYSANRVWPVFDQAMTELLPSSPTAPNATTDSSDAVRRALKAYLPQLSPAGDPKPQADVDRFNEPAALRRLALAGGVVFRGGSGADVLAASHPAVGRWSFDPEIGSLVLTADPGVEGFLTSRQYLSLGEGAHVLRLVIAGAPDALDLGTLDVRRDGEVIAEQRIRISGPGQQTISLPFAVAQPGGKFEFRILASGAARVTVLGLSLDEVADAKAPMLEAPP